MSRRLLVLGAGIFQLPLIRKAQLLGCTVCATSYQPNDPGLRAADRAFDVSIIDFDGLERLCRKERIDAVLTAGSDLGSLAVGRLNDRLGWTGLTENQVRRVSDKQEFVRLQQDLALPHPQSFFVDSDAGRAEALRLVEAYPVIMKPRYASGSQGIRVCRNPEEVTRYHDAVSASSLLDKGYVLQRFLDGVEHGGECLVEGGKVAFLRLTHKYHNDRKVPLGHCVPFDCSPAVAHSLRLQVEKIAASLCVRNSAVNLDLILTPEGVPNLIDFSFRLGGNLLPHLMYLAYGIDTTERVVRYCLQESLEEMPPLRESDGWFGSIIFGGARQSALTEALAAATRTLFEESTRVIELVFDILPGERYEIFHQSSRRFGHALFRVGDRSAYERVLETHQAILRDESLA